MAQRNRPPGTELIIPEDYVAGLEEDIEEAQAKVQLWKKCLGHTIDFLEVLRSHFDNFDKVLKEVNEMDSPIEFVVDADENIKYRINESEES